MPKFIHCLWCLGRKKAESSCKPVRRKESLGKETKLQNDHRKLEHDGEEKGKVGNVFLSSLIYVSANGSD
ncbi:DUF3667 domain-containing protein [Sesbania bispinosa]|nr:DUF3667 domain-containing protein [Sesbania bispinosa]